MSGPERVRRDIGYYALATILPAFLGFAGVVLLVRLLGEDAYGRVSVVMGAALMVAAYASGWVAQAVLRFHAAARVEGGTAALEDTAGALQLRALLLLLPLLVVWLLVTPDLPLGASLGGALLCTAAALYQLRAACAQADFRPGDVMRGETVRSAAIPVAALLAAWWFDGSVTVAIAVMAAGYLGAWLLLGGRVRGATDRTLAARLWSYGWPMGLWFGFSQLLTYLDRYLVALHHGYDMAGRYSAGFELVRRGLVLALAPVTLAVHPALVSMWTAQEHGRAARLWRRSLLLQALGALAIVAAYVPIAGRIQQLAFDFSLDWRVNLAMALSGAAWAVALMAHKPLELQLRTRAMLVALVAAAALNAAGNVLLVPRYGMAAAAAVSAASALAYLLLVLAMAPRLNDPAAVVP